VEEAALLNTATYLERLADDPRYRKAANAKLPKKIGRHLRLFDCITCDKCVPVCPNDANFTFDLPREEIPVVRLHPAEDGWSVERGDPLRIEERHQIGSFADFCNDCGNCDVFCPEDGGPYAVKPRFFGTVAAWEADGRDGFWIGRAGGRDVVLGRFDGAAYRVERDGAGRARFEGPDFAVELAEGDPESTARGRAGGPVDLTYFRILLRVRAAVLRREGTTWPTATSA
jgi:putative selenate reductase